MDGRAVLKEHGIETGAKRVPLHPMYGGDSGATAGQDVAADSSSEFVPMEGSTAEEPTRAVIVDEALE